MPLFRFVGVVSHGDKQPAVPVASPSAAADGQPETLTDYRRPTVPWVNANVPAPTATVLSGQTTVQRNGERRLRPFRTVEVSTGTVNKSDLNDTDHQ